jgi:type I site-specific restriction-modification system R (restriction) subunit
VNEAPAVYQTEAILANVRVQLQTLNDMAFSDSEWVRFIEEYLGVGEESGIDRDDVVFEVDLLKSQEINLDYILELIFERNKKAIVLQGRL